MKLHRPHIPVSVRIKVAQRQLRELKASDAALTRDRFETQDVYLDRLLTVLSLYFESLFQPLHLDHDPALTNRIYYPRTRKYVPDANDPKFLIYRTKLAHDIKTRVRGDGAQLSDLAIRRKNKRIEKRRELKPNIPKAAGHFLAWKRAQQRKRSRKLRSRP